MGFDLIMGLAVAYLSLSLLVRLMRQKESYLVGLLRDYVERQRGRGASSPSAENGDSA
ncbi:MAG: hypothetical protein KatS3mg111_4289 [Pirellulaceae bacterium]|nr:MAG: hypothetical protein KatS3mg111_4289 [Pirellulaceae bacterium]